MVVTNYEVGYKEIADLEELYSWKVIDPQKKEDFTLQAKKICRDNGAFLMVHTSKGSDNSLLISKVESGKEEEPLNVSGMIPFYVVRENHQRDRFVNRVKSFIERLIASQKWESRMPVVVDTGVAKLVLDKKY